MRAESSRGPGLPFPAGRGVASASARPGGRGPARAPAAGVVTVIGTVIVTVIGAAVVAGSGCVTDALVINEESEIRAVRNETAALAARARTLRAEIVRLEARAGPRAAAERRLEFERDLARRGLRVTSRGPEIVVTLASTVLFGPGEVRIREDAREAVLAVARAIRERFPERHVRVEGHTDSAPPRRVADAYPTNWELSAARALAVVRFLIDRGEMPKTQVSAAAFGEHRPVTDNATPEGRKANRRVDIVILPPVGIERVTTAETAR